MGLDDIDGEMDDMSNFVVQEFPEKYDVLAVDNDIQCGKYNDHLI